MQIIKTRQIEVKRIRNDASYTCNCGRCPTYRYNYRFFVGNQWCWTYGRCQECMQTEFVEFDRGITQAKTVLPSLPKIQWKKVVPGRWNDHTRHSILPYE